ncbi:hypothetical protein L2E82_05482 [Cichorium intybus]|uniref:Uncharacterized protein n=1 Tax=Cichorium intybus TaxID=13427 RepID=A0ACB9H856_CICIN|nr:hypothetical protein L2E82_05482 [Cichorium intybus]
MLTELEMMGSEFIGKNLLDVVVDLDSHLLGQIHAVSGETSDGNADVVVDLEENADLDDRRRGEVKEG